MPCVSTKQEARAQPALVEQEVPAVVEAPSMAVQTERVYSCYLHSHPCDGAKNESGYEKGVSTSITN